jgi:phage-related protein
LVDDHDGNTYRAGYTVRFKEVIYVLHVFRKKSPKASKTAQVDIDLIERRLKIAHRDYEVRRGKTKR